MSLTLYEITNLIIQKNVGCLYLFMAINYNKFSVNLFGKAQLNYSSHDLKLRLQYF